MSESITIATIAAIFTAITAITGVYRFVYIPKMKARDEKREKIYKPLLQDVDALTESVKKRKNFSAPFNWKTVEENVSPKLFEGLTELFEVKASSWYKLLEHNRDFVRLQCYFYLDKNIENLQKEFKELGVGALESELYEAIVTPILEREKISLRWLEDNKNVLFENLKKCPSYKNINNLLDWVNKESPCLIFYKNAEKSLLQSVQKMRSELKSF